MSRPDWMKYKQTLGYDFPNLPFYQVFYQNLTNSIFLKYFSSVLDLPP